MKIIFLQGFLGAHERNRNQLILWIKYCFFWSFFATLAKPVSFNL